MNGKLIYKDLKVSWHLKSGEEAFKRVCLIQCYSTFLSALKKKLLRPLLLLR